MKRAPKTALAVAAIAIVLLALIAACGGSDDDSSREGDSPGRIDRGQTREPTEQASQGDTERRVSEQAEEPTDEPDRQSGGLFGGSAMGLEEYADFCADDWGLGGSADPTFGELSDAYGRVIDELEAINPPDGVTEWHEANLDFAKSFKQAIDDYPGARDDTANDAQDYLATAIIPLALAMEGEMAAIVQAMDPSAAVVMAAAGCIDDAMVLADSTPEGISRSGADWGDIVGRFARHCGQSFFSLSFELMPDGSMVTIDVRISRAGFGNAPRQDATFAQESALHGQLIKGLESLNPPPEFAEWHLSYLYFLYGIKQVLDNYPGDGNDSLQDNWDSVRDGIDSAVIAAAPELQAAVQFMDPGVREVLAAAGCFEYRET